MWPLHFGKIIEHYPVPSHARLMAHGMFGGFIFGFLGTALPRMLSVPALTIPEVLLVFGLHLAMTAAHGAGKTAVGDTLFLTAVGAMTAALFVRFLRRKDMPPPGFVLVMLAFAGVAAGLVLSFIENRREISFFAMALERLLLYQGFILLPVLGVGPFILPRFFGLTSRHEFPESRIPPPGWMNKATGAASAGLLVVASFVVEAAGWPRAGYLLRLVTTAAYLLREIPVYRAEAKGNSLATALKIAFALLLLGLLTIALFPVYRVSLLHLALVGGFGIITFAVATRVVFGHSGNQALLSGPNRWLIVAVALMLLGMATRISGDFWPKILVTHYSYGAVLWGLGVLLWARYVLPKVGQADSEQ